MNWTAAVVQHLEKNCFYRPDGTPLLRKSDKYMLDLVKEIYKPGTSILDFGCGTGRMLDLMLKHDIDLEPVDYLGYDTSIAMLDQAINKFPGFYFDDKFIHDKEPYQFELIICNDVLQHVSNVNEFKDLMSRISALGKKVIFHFWYEEGSNSRYQTVNIAGENFHEFWISQQMIQDICFEMGEKTADGGPETPYSVTYFPNVKPYKCAVMTIDNTYQAEKNTVSLPEEYELEFIELHTPLCNEGGYEPLSDSEEEPEHEPGEPAEPEAE